MAAVRIQARRKRPPGSRCECICGSGKMKIYIIPVPALLQPNKQVHMYPVHNKDYGVEQDFHYWLKKQDLLTTNPSEADWHYLPVYWTRWHINHHFAANGEGLAELQGVV